MTRHRGARPPGRRRRRWELSHIVAGHGVDLVPASLFLALAGGYALVLPLWRDEDATMAFSSLPLTDLFTATSHVDRVFLPYYALVHALRGLGLGTVALRLLSVLAAAGAVVLVQVIARRLWSRDAGLVGGLVLALNPTFVLAGPSLRPYGAAAFCTALATWLLVTRGPRWWPWYVGTVVVLTQLHLFGAALALAHTLWIAIVDRAAMRRVVTAWAVAAAAAAPLAITAARQTGQVSWIEAPTPASVVGDLAYATGGTLTSLTAGTVLVVVASAVIGWTRRDDGWLLGILLWLGPLVTLAAASVLVSPMLVPRYLHSTPVGAAILVACAAHVVAARMSSAPPWPAFAVLALVLGLVLGLVAGRAHRTSAEGHPQVDSSLASSLHPGDLLVVRQRFSETGFAHGFATNLHDEPFTRSTVAALVTGQPTAFVRQVVTSHESGVTSREGTVASGARGVVVGIDPGTLADLGLPRCHVTSERAVGDVTVRGFSCP